MTSIQSERASRTPRNDLMQGTNLWFSNRKTGDPSVSSYATSWPMLPRNKPIPETWLMISITLAWRRCCTIRGATQSSGAASREWDENVLKS